MLSTQREGLKPMAMQANNICFALFIAAAILGIVELPYSGRFGLGFEMVSIAKNLADTGRFANPIRMLDTGYTAANPPLYPLFLAVLFKVFGSPTSVAFAALMANVVANALTASWLPRVSLLFFGDLMPGVVASVLWMASVQVMPSWDMDFTVAGLILFCLIAPVGLKPESGIVSGFGVGALAGLLFLLNPSSLLVWLPWVGYLLFRRKAAVRQTLVATLTVSLFFFAWGGRNYLRLGAFVMRTNLGQTLYASNNDCAQSSMAADNLSDCYGANHPNESLSEARLMRSMGEVRYDRLRTRDAKMWIAEHPARFRQLTLQRIREFWFPAVFLGSKPGTASLSDLCGVAGDCVVDTWPGSDDLAPGSDRHLRAGGATDLSADVLPGGQRCALPVSRAVAVVAACGIPCLARVLLFLRAVSKLRRIL